jgi:hypothetical protein
VFCQRTKKAEERERWRKRGWERQKGEESKKIVSTGSGEQSKPKTNVTESTKDDRKCEGRQRRE